MDIRVGPANDTLAAMTGETAFDFVFIDGDHRSPGFDVDVEFYCAATTPGEETARLALTTGFRR